jgi:phenylpropionate dioxygenase-like ring-hydroxylating dioxygenase large terminal subunit
MSGTTTADELHSFSILRKTWQPVALSRALARDNVVSATLLGEDIVVARLQDGLAAFRDGCAHRGARFGIGSVVDGQLQCPYHGWRYSRSGQCELIPSLGADSAVCRTVRLHSYRVKERYGMIWVRLDDEELASLPDVAEFEDPAWTYVIAEPTPFGCGFRREIENYLDMSHFAFAHVQTLGKGAAAEIERYRLSEFPDGLKMEADFPAMSSADSLSKLQQAHRRIQRLWLPNFTTIRQSYPDGSARVLVHIPSPHTATSCTVFWSIAISPNYIGPPAEEQLAFAERVLDEDRIMCENQRPLEAPLAIDDDGARYVPADRFALTYRRRFQQFCAAHVPAETR